MGNLQRDGLAPTFAEGVERTASAFEAWIAFVHARCHTLDPDFPLDGQALADACRDGWLVGEGEPGQQATRLVDWVRARLPDQDPLGEPLEPWRAALLEAGLRLLSFYQGPFVEALAVVSAPFLGTRTVCAMLDEYELGKAEQIPAALERVGLLSAHTRRVFRHYRVLRNEYEDAQSFLDDLHADLGDIPPLASVERRDLDALWNEGTASDELLAALGSCLDIDHGGFVASLDWRHRGEAYSRLTGNVARLALTDGASAAWQPRWERLFFLLCPVVHTSLMLEGLAVTADALPRQIKGWAASRRDGLVDAVERLIRGDGLLAGAHAALREAGVDPAILRIALVDRPYTERRIEDDAQRPLLRAMVAGVGRRSAPQDARWWCDSYLALARPECDPETADLFRPFAMRAVACPDAFAHAARDVRDYQLEAAWSRCALDEAALENPALYDLMVDRFGLEGRKVRPAAAARHPDRWLERARERFEEVHVVSDDGVRTPAVLGWYREILPRVPDDRMRQPLLYALAPSLAEAELADLLRDWYQGSYRPVGGLVERLTDFSTVAGLLDAPNTVLAMEAARRVVALVLGSDEDSDVPPDPAAWSRLLEVSARHADVMSSDGLIRPNDDPARLALLWQHAHEPRNRMYLALALLARIRRGGNPDDARIAGELIAHDPTPFEEAVDSYVSQKGQPLAQSIAAAGGELLRLVPRLALIHLSWKEGVVGRPMPPLDPGPLDAALASHPYVFDALTNAERIRLLPYLRDAGLSEVGTRVVTMLDDDEKGTLVAPAAAMVRGRGRAALEASGLLASDSPRVRRALHRGLAAGESDEVLDLVRDRLDDTANGDYERGLLLDRLERAGQDLAAHDPLLGVSDEDLRAAAARTKAARSVKKLMNGALEGLFQELGSEVCLMMLTSMQGGTADGIPRVARQIIERLSPARRQDLVLETASAWIASNGSPKLEWLMQPVPELGDERTADALAGAAVSWSKTRKPKARQAIAWLARMPGDYPVAKIDMLRTHSKVTATVSSAAQDTLADIAHERGMAYEDLLDTLAPDFGMAKGVLVLELGPYAYRAEVASDLTLRVVNEKGKRTRSLPKARAGEDEVLRATAEARFAALRKGIKPLVKSQVTRLALAVTAGRSWPLDAWRKVYLEHPFLRSIGQRVLWSGLDADAAPVATFRPAEDGVVLGLDDEAVPLHRVVRVRITHPIELDAAARGAWQSHFSDYEIESPIGQWLLGTALPEPVEIEDDLRLTRQQGFVIPRPSFAALVKRHDYLPVHEGSRIVAHARTLADGREVVLVHTAISPSFVASERVAIDHFRVGRRQRDDDRSPSIFTAEAISSLPPTVQAGMVQLADELAANGEGFDPGWRKL